MKKTIKKPSPYPFYAAAGVFILFALILPIYKLWALILDFAITIAALMVLKKCLPEITEVVDVRPSYRTGIKELDDALMQADSYIESLRMVENGVTNGSVKSSVSRMIKASEAVLIELNDNPQKTFAMRKFLTYLLPTSSKLMESYLKQELLSNRGENAEEILRKIEENSGRIADAFEDSADKLYAGDAIDVASDIDVLDGMVNKEFKTEN